MVRVPDNPKIYHIASIDRLESILGTGYLYCDQVVKDQNLSGTTIGMNEIKARRLEINLDTYPSVAVGGCVPFYFCPRSVMLYILFRRNHESLEYRVGQEPIIHLEADLRTVVDWANKAGRKWVFTLSNAGSFYFEERSDLSCLGELDWGAIQAIEWSQQELKEHKQAEFLVEEKFPFSLVERVGVSSDDYGVQVLRALQDSNYHPKVETKKDWYY